MAHAARTQGLRLQILATSDVHMHLVPEAPQEAGGIAPPHGLHRLLPVIDALRAGDAGDAQITLLVDNGDLLQGTPLADYLVAQGDRAGTHPVAEMFNATGYDALGLGNHDLDFGLDYLGWFARSLTAPVVASSLRVSPQPDWLLPRALLRRGPLSIGIASVMPRNAPEWVLGSLDGDVDADEMRGALARTAGQLRADGADLVIALAHSGLGGAASDNQLDLMAQDGNADVLVGGHNHERFPAGHFRDLPGANVAQGLLHGVPTVMPGRGAEALGVVTLDLERSQAGAWSVARANARLVYAPDHGEKQDAEPPAAARPLVRHSARADAWLNASVGTTCAPLNSYFSRLQPTRLIALTAAAMMRVIDTERSGTAYGDLPLIGIAAPTRAGGQGGPTGFTDIAAGPVTRRDLLDLAHFDDKIWAVVLTGAELRVWLERVASQFCHLCPDGAAAELIDPHVPTPDCDSIWGISYGIDPTRPPRCNAYGDVIDPLASRVTRLSHDGRPIADTDQFLAALTSYRAAGGGRFPGMRQDRAVLRSSVSKTQAIGAALAQPDMPLPEARWQLDTDGKGAETWLDTGPGAADHLSDIAALQSGAPVPLASGFLRIPIRL